MRVTLGLVNELVVGNPDEPARAVAGVFAFDPASVADRPDRHVDALLDLGRSLHAIVVALDEGRVDDAAERLNELLVLVPAMPHLAYEDGQWRLHHHPRGAGVVDAWTSICAESLARLVGEGHADRVHRCAALDCRRAFIDTTKNATRRYCSERCQNRTKAAALRRRRG